LHAIRITHAFTTLAAAFALAIVSLGPVSAKDKADDKKPAPQAPAVNDEYRVGPADKLRIEVYKDPQLSQSVQVRPDGKITLPLIGDLEADGHTPIELRDTITTSFKEYVTNPTVTVIVVEALASKVYVMGEVTHPGTMDLHGPTTILQALAMAGGFTDFANRKDITIVRGTEKLHFNYKDAVDDDSKREPMQLRAGDTVIVK
jgi:polysaccharide export outer membrane protein